MAYCKKCGEKIDDGTIVCPKCGETQSSSTNTSVNYV